MTIATDQSKVIAGVKADQWTRIYRRMVMIREFEEQVNELQMRALMPGLAHLYEVEAGSSPCARIQGGAGSGVESPAASASRMAL
jgi:TPP-dependent pyruvate/acetoin dehydrogenase alpha subunit